MTMVCGPHRAHPDGMGLAIAITLIALLVLLVAYGAVRQRRTASRYSDFHGDNIDVKKYDYGADRGTPF